ncbi:type-F conjugative transfer system pilin assembly protein TrbC [Escherichia coli]|jgi:conjugal transfer pilus assembly protein TrbC|uniref:type-F conjugative transfer system pilin assembly protein TrbC n=1 Tax=Escherichia coli TaxID=562 RepID=UPI002DBBA83D|nr:type-F conjugative transfer system pilin assembly protein TrbC [Escherichia coli]MEC4256299.1 type-F conjugative transfer system pilin assembly protein TrbC [Escherichia coli]
MKPLNAALLTGACLTVSLSAQAQDGTQVTGTENETAYFLSSSLPDKELALLMKAAEEKNIPVYFRGLINDNMDQTAKYMLNLITTYRVRGVQIDPVRFGRYGVKQVPALVKKCGDHFDIVYGNVALNQALDMIETRGDCRKKS